MNKTSQGEIHIWQGKLFALPVDSSVLSEREQLSARAYPTAQQQRKYIYCHSILRNVLATYMDISADNITFTTNKNGKPYLVSDRHRIFFNLSHTDSELAIVISQTDEVGIDIEAQPQSHTMRELAEYFLSPKDMKNVNTLAFEEIEMELLRAWTQKEAITKALGQTLAHSLKHLSLPMFQSNYVYDHNEDKIHVKEFLLSKELVGAIASRHELLQIEKFNCDTLPINNHGNAPRSSVKTHYPQSRHN